MAALQTAFQEVSLIYYVIKH